MDEYLGLANEQAPDLRKAVLTQGREEVFLRADRLKVLDKSELVEVGPLFENEEAKEAEQRFQSWHFRVMTAPCALCVLALPAIAGSELMKIDLAASLVSISALSFGSIIGSIVPLSGFAKAKGKLELARTFAIWKSRLSGWDEQIQTLKSAMDETTRVVTFRQRPVKIEVDDPAVFKNILEAVEKTKSVRAGEKEAAAQLEAALKKQRKSEMLEFACFFVSMLLLLFAIINPIWVLSLGPIWEWSPAGLDLAKAAAK